MKYRILNLFCVSCCVIMFARTADAQVLDTGSAIQDAGEVVRAVDTFFDAFARQDSTTMASMTDPGSRLVVTTFASDGTPIVRPIPMDRFISLVANRQGAPIEETIWNRQVEVTDNLATVWVHYNLWVGDDIDHCGRDAV